MSDESTHGEIVPAASRTEQALDIAAVVTALAPWIGGAVSAVLSGMAFDRKMGRVAAALGTLGEELEGFQSQASEEYVRTEDFEELLETTLRRVAEERNEGKRRIYAEFLVGAIKSPGESYDEQLRFLRTLEGMQPDHLRVLKAMSLPPEGGSGFTGSPGQTLRNRLPDMDDARLRDLVSQTNDMRVTNLTSLGTMMTYEGSQELRSHVTPYGQRFLGYLSGDETEA